MAHPVIHWEILGPDGPALHTFYHELFGWPVTVDNPMGYGMVDAAETGIGGGIGSTPDLRNRVVIYVQVPDLQVALDQAVALGGKVLMPTEDIGPVVLAQFTDPAGNVIGLIKG